MNYTIHQESDFWIYRNKEIFLKVKRKGFWGIASKFSRGENLILVVTTFGIFNFKWISIKHNSFKNNIRFDKVYNKFVLLEGENHFFIDFKSGILEKPFYDLYLNDVKRGSIRATKLIQVGCSDYIMETDIEDENQDICFLVLFISQQLPIG